MLRGLLRLMIWMAAIFGHNLWMGLRLLGLPSGKPSWPGLVKKLKDGKTTAEDWVRRL